MYMSVSVNSVVSCMSAIQRDLYVREHKSVKEGDSKSALNQHQVKTRHMVLSKPGKSMKLSTSSF